MYPSNNNLLSTKVALFRLRMALYRWMEILQNDGLFRINVMNKKTCQMLLLKKQIIQVLKYSFLPRERFLVSLHASLSPEENSRPRLMVSIVNRLTSTNMITQKYTINRFNIFSTDPILFMLILEFNAIWNKKKRLWWMRENEHYIIIFSVFHWI